MLKSGTIPEALDLETDLMGEADREYTARIDAERCTLEFSQPIRSAHTFSDSPLFGQAQASLFEEVL